MLEERERFGRGASLDVMHVLEPRPEVGVGKGDVCVVGIFEVLDGKC